MSQVLTVCGMFITCSCPIQPNMSNHHTSLFSAQATITLTQMVPMSSVVEWPMNTAMVSRS